MKFKHLCLAVALGCGILQASAQSGEQAAEQIRQDESYIYGEGFGNTYAEADKNALENLTSKIAVNLNHTFTSVEENVDNASGSSFTSTMESIVNTYSQATLTNTHSVMISDAPDAHVMRYISRAEVEKVFEQRRDKVGDMVRSAMKAESKGKIDDALRYYYWALTLVKSLQYPNEVTYTDNGNRRVLMSWIPERINDIFDNLKVNVAAVEGNDVTLFFTYKGSPVTSLDFSFFNGNSWTMLNSAKDGASMIEIRPGVDINTLKIGYEYEYTGEAQIDPEIQSVIKIFKSTYFGKSQVQLSPGSSKVKDMVSKEARREMNNAKAETANIQIASATSDKQLQKTIESVVNAVSKGDYTSIRQHFNDEGWTMMDRLLHYGRAKVLGGGTYSFYDFPDGRTVCRSVPMSFSFPNNHRTFTEDVVFTFGPDRLIHCVAFGLGSEAKTDIFDKGVGVWSESSKLALVDFLENYKTAFALERIDYLESIFDDNAVIITGHVTKRTSTMNKKDGSYTFDGGDVVTYNQFTKNQYMDKLRRVFANNEFVNIHFSDNDVVKMGKGGEVYGIQIHQDYYSSRYGDTGYLFLLVDINDPQQPIITVRTWQPERDPNINGRLPRNHPDFGIIGPGNF